MKIFLMEYWPYKKASLLGYYKNLVTVYQLSHIVKG